MRTWHLAIALLALGAAGCVSAQAKGSDKPALNVPPPPSHVVELPAEPLEPVGEIPSPNATPPPRPGRTTRDSPPKPQNGEAKPENKPADTPPAPETAPATTPAAPPAAAPQLRTPETADPGAAAKNARNTIESARSTLAKVNFGPLNSERKKAYNDAKLFIQQAEDALKEGNIVFAQAVATKAETLAHELAGR
jgi:outer membrane biosynthesis protein TonB